jgi:hypothetical protein
MSNSRNIADIFSKSTAISTDAEVSTAVVAERTTVATLSGKTLLAPAMTNIIVTPTSTTGTPITINGIASQSADYLNINTLATGGTNIVKIDVNGNLGLGKTPTNKLDVNGTVAISGNILVNTVSASGPNLEILNSNGTNGTIAARASSGTDAGVIWAQANTYYSGPSYTSTGLVQNGTNISGTSYGFANGGLGILSFQNTSGAVIQTNGGSSIVIATNSTERMRIDSNGNLSVGGAGTANNRLTLSNASRVRWDLSTTTVQEITTNTAENTYLDKASDALSHSFKTSGTERMRIGSSGDISISNSSQANIGIQSGSQAKFWISAQAGVNTLSIGGNGGSAPTSGAINIDGAGLVTINGGIAGKLIKRITSITDSATPSPNSDTTDMFLVTALGQTATFAAPSGTPTQGQQLMIRVKDNGTARTLAWNTIYRASADLSLPTTTVASKTLYLGFIYNSTDTKWDLIAALGNF